jgi:hypothetical protein
MRAMGLDGHHRQAHSQHCGQDADLLSPGVGFATFGLNFDFSHSW